MLLYLNMCVSSQVIPYLHHEDDDHHLSFSPVVSLVSRIEHPRKTPSNVGRNVMLPPNLR